MWRRSKTAHPSSTTPPPISTYKYRYMNKLLVLSFGLSALLLAACDSSTQSATPPADSTHPSPMDSTGMAQADTAAATLPNPDNFRDTADGKTTALYILRSGRLSAAITNYGARVVSLIAPDKNG